MTARGRKYSTVYAANGAWMAAPRKRLLIAPLLSSTMYRHGHFTQGQIERMVAQFEEFRLPGNGQDPNDSPTDIPMLPTQAPSSLPSISSEPSLSQMPTASTQPSMTPTESTSPSMLPSEIPSWSPTISGAPSLGPTLVPTKTPSEIPTISRSPSEEPSPLPSYSPSKAPTFSSSTGPDCRPQMMKRCKRSNQCCSGLVCIGKLKKKKGMMKKKIIRRCRLCRKKGKKCLKDADCCSGRRCKKRGGRGRKGKCK